MRFLVMTLTLLTFAMIGHAHDYTYCEGEGGLWDSNEEVNGSFEIIDSQNIIRVEWETGESADYRITEDTTSQSYRPGDQLLRGEFERGETIFNLKDSKHLTVWIPRKYYRDNNPRGSMDFGPERYGNSVGGHVLMKCYQEKQ